MTPSTATERSSFSRKSGTVPIYAKQGLSIFLLGLEAALDPVGRLHALRRVHLVRGIALHVDDGELALDELRLPVGGFHDRLVALAVRHLHRSAGAFEAQVLERRADLLIGRRLAAIGVLRLLPGELHGEERLRHLVGGVVRLVLVLADEATMEPLVVLVIRRIRTERPARAEDRDRGDLRAQRL